MALGLFSNYAELGQRAFTKWRSLATDVFVQDSWKPTQQPDHRRRHPLGVLAAVVLDDQQHRQLRSALLRPGDRGDHQSRAPAGSIGGDRYNGIVLPGDGFVGDAQRSRRGAGPAGAGAVPRRAARLLGDALQRVRAATRRVLLGSTRQTVVRASAGVFHNRVTLNDSTLLGGNPPFQPMVTVVERQRRQPRRRRRRRRLCRSGSRAQDVVFKHPTSYMWSAGVQREVPLGFVVDVTYVGRRGLYLQRERNINQLQAGHDSRRTPASTSRRCGPYKGYGAIRISENAGYSKYNSLQISADRRYTQRPEGRRRLHAGEVGGQRAATSATSSGTPTTTPNYWGPSSFDRRHVLNVYYIYDLPFWRDGRSLLKSLLGGWQISGATFMRTGTPFSITRTDDIAGVGEGSNRTAGGSGRRSLCQRQRQVLGGVQRVAGPELLVQPDGVRAPAAGTFGNATRNLLRNPGDQQWDIALFKNFALGGHAGRCSSARRSSTSRITRT